MENEALLSIWSNPEFTEEEKVILSKEYVREIKLQEQKAKYDESYDKYNDNQKPVVERTRNQAAETRIRLEQANYDAQLKERMEILSFLKNNNGQNQYSKDYLVNLSGVELNSMYEDNLRDMPEAMNKAKEERRKAKEQGETIFEDYKLNTSESDDKNKVDLESLKNKMSKEESQYLLMLNNISKERNVSLDEAEKIYQTELNPKQTEEVKDGSEESKEKVNDTEAEINEMFGENKDDGPTITPEPEEKPRRLVTRIVNKVVDLFKRSRKLGESVAKRTMVNLENESKTEKAVDDEHSEVKENEKETEINSIQESMEKTNEEDLIKKAKEKQNVDDLSKDFEKLNEEATIAKAVNKDGAYSQSEVQEAVNGNGSLEGNVVPNNLNR